MDNVIEFFVASYTSTPAYLIWLEGIAFVFGILSVWYAKNENILVYPTGIICTAITVYILYVSAYFGDMMMNFYYSVMSIYGWWNWSRKSNDKYLIPISKTNQREKLIGLLFFVLTIIVTYSVYRMNDYVLEIPNYIDVVTSGIFFTAMWYMANKKIENWVLWIVADIITIPLYAYRGLGMLSLQYLIFTILAIQGYFEWKKSLEKKIQVS